MIETAQETTAVTATLVEHEPEVLPAVTDEKKITYLHWSHFHTCWVGL